MATKHHPSNLYSHPNSTIQDNHENELEGTISLCDLPIYGNDTNYSTTSMKGEESFRFFSEEWMKNNEDSNIFPNQDILFCGKLIVPKQPVSNDTQEFKKRDYGSTKVDVNSGSSRDREFAKLISMNKGRNHDSERKTKKVVFQSSGTQKSRWYYYGLRLAGVNVPVEIDISAIKTRQNRHQKAHGKEGSGGSRHGKGLGRLIRDLSCDGPTQANLMVKASLVCIPRV